MNNGMDNKKQLMAAGVLGIGVVGAVGHAMWTINAAHAAPAPVAPISAPAASNGNAAAPAPAPAADAAPAVTAPGGPAGSPVITEASLTPLPAEQLRNPFQGPADSITPAAAKPAALPAAAPAKPAAAVHPAAAPAVRPAPAVRSGGGGAPRSRPAPTYMAQRPINTGMGQSQWSGPALPPVVPMQVYTPGVQTTQVVRVPSTPVTPPTPPVIVPPPPTPAQIYETDAAALRSSVMVRGVLIGAPSTAFVTVNGAQQLLHVGDSLPGGFQVAAITDNGIVVFYSKSAGLNKSFQIAL